MARQSFGYGSSVVGTNPTVLSKGSRNARENNFKPSDPRNAQQPAPLETRDVAPSAPNHSHVERASSQVQPVGWVDGKFVKPMHVNSGKHGLDGHHDPRTSTDNAQGQSWSASGGQFGRQSIPVKTKPQHKAPDHGAQSSTRQDAGALAGNPGDRTSYSGGKGKI